MGTRRPGCRGRRWARRMQSQEEEFKKAAGLDSAAVKQRAGRMSLRKCVGFGKEEVPDNLGGNAAAA